MSELHKFLFEGMPVRGLLVRLDDAWSELLQRRASNKATGPYPEPVRNLLGEMLAAGTLMQANIKFDGALVLQIFGDGPLKLAVAEVQGDLRLRATATLLSEVEPEALLSSMVNATGQGRCAITLDPKTRFPGQQTYQGVVPLSGADGASLQSLSAVLQQYMRQSEQLETTLVLAADGRIAAGLLIQRLPREGAANLAGTELVPSEASDDDYNRIAILAASLKREELLTLDADTILRRLFWEEPLQRLAPQAGAAAPRFACTCSRERVARMIQGLGAAEAKGIIAERGEIEVGCEFCGRQYRFDAVDAAQVFTSAEQLAPRSAGSH